MTEADFQAAIEAHRALMARAEAVAAMVLGPHEAEDKMGHKMGQDNMIGAIREEGRAKADQGQNVYLHMSEEEVVRRHIKGTQAARMRAYIEACAQRAMPIFAGHGEPVPSPEETEVAIATWNAVVANEQTMAPMPVPAYIFPVKRWAGGDSRTTDNWYWDHNAF